MLQRLLALVAAAFKQDVRDAILGLVLRVVYFQLVGLAQLILIHRGKKVFRGQRYIVQLHRLRGQEALLVGGVILGYFLFGGRLVRHERLYGYGQVSQVALLGTQLGVKRQFQRGAELAAHQAGAQLGKGNILGQGLLEIGRRKTGVGQHAGKQLGRKLSLDLELLHVGDQGAHFPLGRCQVQFRRRLHQQLAVYQ